ncbi:protein of unknown function [Tepidibacter aestuarii]|nr:protein of unknown function [Tepidibacter aestuarii]
MRRYAIQTAQIKGLIKEIAELNLWIKNSGLFTNLKMINDINSKKIICLVLYLESITNLLQNNFDI